MSISSFDNFSEQLQKLPVQNPPKGLLLDVQNTIQRRKAFKQKATQCGVVLSLFVATLWVVVDQQSNIQPTADVANEEGIEEGKLTAEQKELEFTRNIAALQQPSFLTRMAIAMRITDIDVEMEQLPQSETARRQELLQTRSTLKANYRSIRLQEQAEAYQKVAYYN